MDKVSILVRSETKCSKMDKVCVQNFERRYQSCYSWYSTGTELPSLAKFGLPKGMECELWHKWCKRVMHGRSPPVERNAATQTEEGDPKSAEPPHSPRKRKCPPARGVRHASGDLGPPAANSLQKMPRHHYIASKIRRRAMLCALQCAIHRRTTFNPMTTRIHFQKHLKVMPAGTNNGTHFCALQANIEQQICCQFVQIINLPEK
uniref:Uncharacterized protein n=1 Tax=Globodera rostochiensis TaxID=31243 RepID=A0A914I490_GLORO